MDEIQVGDRVRQTSKSTEDGVLKVTRINGDRSGAICVTPKDAIRWVRMDQLEKVGQ